MKRQFPTSIFLAASVLASAFSVSQSAVGQQDASSRLTQQMPSHTDDAVLRQRCQEYMQKMYSVLQVYDQTVSTNLIGAHGLKTDPPAMRSAAITTLKLAKQMKAIKAPKEIAVEHAQLAASLPKLHDFFVLNSGGINGLNKGLSLAGQIQTTLGTYHSALQEMIARHDLDPHLDPIALEQESLTQRAVEGIQQFTQQAGIQQFTQQAGIQQFAQQAGVLADGLLKRSTIASDSPTNDPNQPDNALAQGVDLRGTLAVPLIQEPRLQQLDSSKGQDWRHATMNLSGSMCPACLLELEGNLRHLHGVTFAHIIRQPASQTQPSNAKHNIATAVIVYDQRFINLNQLERCIKVNKYKASEICELSQW